MKIFDIADIGQVKVKKTKRRSMSIKVSGEEIIVVIPKWAPYRLGIEFAKNKTNWINKHKKQAVILKDQDNIGFYHKINIKPESTLTSRVSNNVIIINTPFSNTDAKTQSEIKKAAKRALRKEGNIFLKRRLEYWSNYTGLNYNDVRIKDIKTRWGSYSSMGNLNLSIYLMQTNENLIDYVIVHELAHSKHMNHSDRFWKLVEQYIPDYKIRRREIKKYPLHIVANTSKT